MATTSIRDLCDSGSPQMMDDDFLDILSGRFATQSTSNLKVLESEVLQPLDGFRDSQFVSQVPVVEVAAEKVQLSEGHPRKLLDSSEDEAEATENDVRKQRRKSKKKRKQKIRKLEFSDDEDQEDLEHKGDLDATELEEEEDLEELEECEEEEDEQEEVFVDYDSEENEVEVKMNKKKIIKAANKYVDEEAELSESEWGSADEDEKGLNKYDIELADEEQFDQNKLQEEVGRIHARKCLDDDIKNVKRIEDLLFTNEEQDGVGRERKFRWANQKSISLEDENARDGNASEESDGDDSELLWRKMRHERETMLSEQSQKMTESDTITDEIVFLDPNSQILTTSSMSLLMKRKFKIIRSTSAIESSLNSIDATKKNSPFLIKTAIVSKFQNSSFLSRDEQTLSRIAKFISHKDEEVTNSSHGSNSMSFMTIDKPDDSRKRKSEGIKLQESSKKQKIEKNTKQRLLDILK